VLSLRANRGFALEELIVAANTGYRSRRLAVIHKVPTAWLPVRNGDGRVSAAKVTEKAAVDFLGHVRLGDGRAVPVAFDAKETRQPRWPLAKLEPHQYEYLADSHATGACAFVLIGFAAAGRLFVLPFPELARCWAAWQGRGRPASVRCDDPALVEVRFPDYLAWLAQKPNLSSGWCQSTIRKRG